MSAPVAPSPRRLRRSVASVLAALLAVPLFFAVAPASPASAWTVPPVSAPDNQHVSSDPLPTVQINGVVWDQFILGNTVYVGGSFSQARPAGSPAGVNQTPRANLLAYNLTTGQLITSFVANTNNEVRTITASPDGSRLYIGGLFTTVNGVSRPRVAALNPTTGAVISAWNGRTDYLVYDMVATDDTVYVGGSFGRAGGSGASGADRMNLAAFNTTNGAVLPWAPTADQRVISLALTPDGGTMFAAGMFGQINGQTRRGFASINAVTGEVNTIAANDDVWAIGSDGAFLDLRIANGAVYGAGYTFGRTTGNLEGIFKVDIATGEIAWIEDCHGDTYQIFPVNGYVYKATHQHFCGNVGGTNQSDANQWNEHTRHASSFKDVVAGEVRRDQWSYHNLEGYPAPSPTSWAPGWTKPDPSFTGLNQATWAVTGNSQYVVYGGEFTRVNNVAQQGLVRFAVRSIAPNNDGPRFSGTDFPIKVVSPASGQVRISFPANFDRDDHILTYELLRNNVVVQTKTAASTYWHWPTISFFDNNLNPGQNVTYRVRVRDPWNNTANSPDYPITVASSGTPSPYANQVIADGANIYWRLGDPVGATTAADSAAMSTGAVNAMTFGRPGAIVGDPDTAAAPTGTTSRVVQPAYLTIDGGVPERNPVHDDFTIEAWFRSTGNQGGRIIGFGESQTGTTTSSNRDRQLYVSNNGNVVFGVRTRPEGTGTSGTRVNRTVQSASGFNNGEWHHVVGTLTGDGMRLYVDGVQVASRTDVNSGTGYYGYWRVGADSLSGWSPSATSSRLVGDIDEAAVYYHVLTPQQIQMHWVLSGRAGNQNPIPSFTSTPTSLNVAFNASASVDLDGSIVSYAWNFGDGTTGSGVSPSHPYGAPGTYQVTLTVTDDDGATGVLTQPVTVSIANQPPTASFTSTPTFLDVAFNGSGSDDVDGSIVSYSWNFGDNTPAGSGVSPSHTYATSGTYQVTLTVTDDDGATGVLTQPVTVEAANQPPTAAFTATPTALNVQFNGSTSSDTDGTIASYSWNFGDDTPAGSGVSPTHAYAEAGTYQVTLTVTDDDGAQGVLTQPVTVSEPTPGTVFARDTFGRSVANGWGTAETGGAWTLSGTASLFSVNGNAGVMSVAVGKTRGAFLNAVSAADVTGSVDLSWNQPASGSGTYAMFHLRRVGADSYFARVRVQPGVTSLAIVRQSGGVGTVLGTVNLALPYTPGDVWRLRFEAEGASPTTLRAKLWNVAGAEPANWQVVQTDSTAALQGAGGVGLEGYVSTTSTATVNASFDELNVQSFGEVPNAAPVAEFSAAATGLDVQFNGTLSSDGDGTIASYSWDFGDGTSDTGATPSHTYAADGTYPVTLTVTDDDGAPASVTHDVTVSAAPAGAVAQDAFTRTVSNTWGDADVGGAWTLSGTASLFSVNGNAGVMSVAVGKTRGAFLNAVSAASVTGSVDIAWDQPASGGGTYAMFHLRRVGADSYFARVRVQPGVTSLAIVRQSGGVGTVLGTVNLALPYTPGDVWRLRFEAQGASPTTLRAKLWNVAGPEPADWQVVQTDSTAGLQGTGAVGLEAYVSSSSTATVNAAYDGLNIQSL
jgi:PKD repeat protein